MEVVMEVLEILYEDNDSRTEFIAEGKPTLTDNSRNELKLSWDYNESQALIKVVEIHYESFYNPMKRKRMWEKISADLSKMGFFRTSKQCNEKWKNLIRSYKSCKDNNKKTGRGPIRFMFFESMDNFFSSKPDSYARIIGIGAEVVLTSDNAFTPEVEVPSISEDSIELSKKRKVNSYCEVLKKKILLDEMKLEEKILANKKKSERHVERMKIMKRKLDLEERKVLAFEKYIVSQK